MTAEIEVTLSGRTLTIEAKVTPAFQRGRGTVLG
jgi:hypothetical protein